MQIIKINENDAGRRLDKFLLKYFDAAPASFVYKNLRKKNIKLCMKRASGDEILKAGDEIELYFADETIVSLSSLAARLFTANDDEVKTYTKQCGAALPRKEKPLYRDMELGKYCSIVYEDENLIIANKKAGVLSQKAKPGDISLNEILLGYTQKSRADKQSDCASTATGMFTPSICNRLDRNTTGLIIFAKTYAAARSLNRMLKDRSLKKYYLTAVEGLVQEKQQIRAWLIKDEKNNKVSIFDREIEGAALIETAYEPLKFDMIADRRATFLKVELITGKTHQIRAHLASEGHPVLGDIKYGDDELARLLRKKYGVKSHILHSWQLDMPEDIEGALNYLSGRRFTAEPQEKILSSC